MAFFSWIFDRTPDITTPPPAWTVTAVKIDLPEVDDEDEAVGSAQPALEALQLDPVYTAIEYVDSRGARSVRRITMLQMKPGPVAPLLRAICHERKGMRSFRTDRIRSFIDPDGVVIPCEEMFNDILGIDLGGLAIRQDPSETLRPALSILVATSRCDGFAHPEEIDAILCYAERELFALGVKPTIEELDALTQKVRRMRPQRSAVETAIDAISEWPADRLNRLDRALRETIVADGTLHPDEITFLEELGSAKIGNTLR